MRCKIILILCLLMPSCIKRKYVSQQTDTLSTAISSNAYLEKIIQQEAMLIDIPIPLYNERIIENLSDSKESDTLVFGYKSPLTIDHAKNLFLHQMERYGWQHLVSFERSEIIMQFQSPYRFCTIIIQKTSDDYSPTNIFIYIKKDEHINARQIRNGLGDE